SGLRLPPPDAPHWKNAPAMPAPKEKADPPSSWDWRALGGVTPVKDQGSCGSCWAFSTMGVVESAILRADGVVVDLSEQHLLSCNTSDWGCSGATWGYSWLIDQPDACGLVGAVFEADYPYTATRWECRCDAPRHYRIREWGYVNGLRPSVDDIKQALMLHGPLGISIYTNAPFSAYGGGVYNACDPDATLFDIDHAIMIVGWDDALGDAGAWIIKNSWGADWGENGFGYVAYGCNLVGFAANYVVYDGLDARLSVSPATGHHISGPAGGPYTPETAQYTVANNGPVSVQWTVTAPAWISTAPAGGTLASGQSEEVTVTVNPAGVPATGGLFNGDLVFALPSLAVEERRQVSLSLPKQVLHSFPLDTDPGWSVTGGWAFGPPQGFSGPNGADPAAAFTGANVYGYNLAGYYENSMTARYLTTPPLDFTGHQDIELRFMRWLGVESSRYDHAQVQASVDGGAWVTLWNHEGGNLAESAWTERVVALPASAANKASVRVRWVMGPTDGTDVYAGWNLDDIEFRGNPYAPSGDPQSCDIDSLPALFKTLLVIGDTDNDGMLAKTEIVVYVPEAEPFWYLFDPNGDGRVDYDEFIANELVATVLPELDANGDNTLSLAEINALTDIITPGILALVDLDNSGGIDCGDLGLVPPAPCEDCAFPSPGVYEAGDDACLMVPGAFSEEALFLWHKEGIGELREGRWLGVQCRSLHIPNLQAEDSGTYYCHYTDGAGKDTYAVYTVTIRVAEELPAASAPILALAVLLAAVLGAGCLGRKRGCPPSVAG
ncbi:MAG TPA: C1 family peptidase, partial [Candidatus Hydrogenedentes bacterium]|nr:C1 family peptidase [Candidatus Hydrogenedentota bacterium]